MIFTKNTSYYRHTSAPALNTSHLRRIAIVGTSGSGKTTLARQLSSLLELPHVELDALHWDRGWTPTPEAIFQQRAGEAPASVPGVSEAV